MTNERVLVTGGAGFTGSHLAHALLQDGQQVRILDDLSRWGTRYKLDWLYEHHLDGLEFVRDDVRDFAAVRDTVQGSDVIYHLAAQVRPGDQRHMAADIARAQSILGWVPCMAFEQGMEETIRWAQNHVSEALRQ